MLMRKFCNGSTRIKERCLLTLVGFASLMAAPAMAQAERDALAVNDVSSSVESIAEMSMTQEPIAASTEHQMNFVERRNEAIDVAKVSQAFGHLIVSNLDNPGFQFDIEAIIKGMRDAMAGLPSPMTEEQYEKAITSIQEKIFNEMATRNLNEANTFMNKNSQEDGVIVLQEGKLHYKVEKEGSGKSVPQDGTPLINYTGKYIDGTVFGSSIDNGAPITLPLDRTIPGFRLGLVGMKEGEKRTLYIHPDLGYGMSGHLPPNSLLVFEIELLEANRDVASADEPIEAPADEMDKEDVR